MLNKIKLFFWRLCLHDAIQNQQIKGSGYEFAIRFFKYKIYKCSKKIIPYIPVLGLITNTVPCIFKSYFITMIIQFISWLTLILWILN